MAESLTELAAMDKHEASKLLFSQINWQELVRAGMFLSQSEVSHSVETKKYLD